MSAKHLKLSYVRSAVGRLMVMVTLIAAVALGLAPGAQAVPLIGLNPSGGNTNILGIQTSPFSASTIGAAGFSSLSGLDVQPGTNTLFASSGFNDGGRLFTVNPATGAATLVGATGFDAVPGLAFDLNGTLYGTAAPTGTTTVDSLITINPSTGAGAAVGGFGGGITSIDGMWLTPRAVSSTGVAGVLLLTTSSPSIRRPAPRPCSARSRRRARAILCPPSRRSRV